MYSNYHVKCSYNVATQQSQVYIVKQQKLRTPGHFLSFLLYALASTTLDVAAVSMTSHEKGRSIAMYNTKTHFVKNV